MLKKLLTLAAAGIIGCTAASCEEEITKEVPATVTLENVHYYEFEKGVPGCVYDSNGNLKGGMSNPGEGQFALSLDVRIKDSNGILYLKKKYGSADSDEPKVLTEKKTEYVSRVAGVGWTKWLWRDAPLTVEVADWKGNITTHNFPLDEIIKQSKPFTVKERIGGSCLTNRDTPPTVTLENVHYLGFETRDPTCLYNSNGEFSGSSSNDEGYFALEFDIKINDPDKVLYERISWGGYNSRPHPAKEKQSEYTTDLSMMGAREQDYRKSPLMIEVADYKGNVTHHKFTFDEIIKDAKPYVTRERVGGTCADRLEDMPETNYTK